jgi:hypothetical protein
MCVSGVNMMERIELWNRFPDLNATASIFASASDQICDAELITLYQFSIPIMRQVYWGLVGEPPSKKKNAWYMDTPIRAMGYFSWANNDSIFLARRVYPQHLGFKYYSHVPNGWGALGLALKEIEERGQDYKSFSLVPDIYSEHALFPYLREAHRLQYRSTLVIPVFKNTSLNRTFINNLEGAFVFYVSNSDWLPEEDKFETSNRFKIFACSMADALDRHLKAIDGVDGVSSISWEDQLVLGKNFNARVVIKLGQPQTLGFQYLITLIQKKLIQRGFSAFVKNTSQITGDNASSEFLIARHINASKELFREAIESTIGTSCIESKCEDYVSYQFEFE